MPKVMDGKDSLDEGLKNAIWLYNDGKYEESIQVMDGLVNLVISKSDEVLNDEDNWPDSPLGRFFQLPLMLYPLDKLCNWYNDLKTKCDDLTISQMARYNIFIIDALSALNVKSGLLTQRTSRGLSPVQKVMSRVPQPEREKVEELFKTYRHLREKYYKYPA